MTERNNNPEDNQLENKDWREDLLDKIDYRLNWYLGDYPMASGDNNGLREAILLEIDKAFDKQAEKQKGEIMVTKSLCKDEYWGYWFTCTGCGYNNIIDGSRFCSGCGIKIKINLTNNNESIL